MADIDLQSMQQTIQWVLAGITLILAIIAAYLTFRKKNYIALAIVIIVNVLSLFVIPIIVAWIVSIACMIWVGKSKPQVKQDLKVSKALKSHK